MQSSFCGFEERALMVVPATPMAPLLSVEEVSVALSFPYAKRMQSLVPVRVRTALPMAMDVGHDDAVCAAFMTEM